MANVEKLAAASAAGSVLVANAIGQLRDAFKISRSVTDEQIAIRHDILIGAMVEASSKIYLADRTVDGAEILGVQMISAAAVS